MAITHTFVSGKVDGADATLVQPSNWNDSHTIANATITRPQLAADATQWEFLGRAALASTNSTVGPVILVTARKHIQIRLWVPTYAAAGIASLQLGGAAIDTGANYCASILEGVTLNTASVSVTGVRMGATAITTPRYATVDVDTWAAGQVKRILARSNSASTSAGTVPTQSQIAGLWINTTNTIQRVQFTAFNSVTGTTTGTFGIGTEFEVWGRDDD